MGVERRLIGVVIAAHSGLFERTVEAFHLAIGPGMRWVGAAMLDAVRGAHGGEAVRFCPLPVGQISDLHPVAGQYCGDSVRHGRHHASPEIRRPLGRGLRVQLGEGQLAGAVNGHEQVQAAFFGADFGKIHVKIADSISLERLFGPFFAGCFGRQAPDAVSLKEAMQRRERDTCGMLSCKACKQSSSGSSVRWRKASAAASSSALRTVETGRAGPIGASWGVGRLRHLATVLGCRP